MSFTAGCVYQLINKATGTAADWSQRDCRSLIGYKDHGNANQQWVIEAAGNNLMYIRSTKSDMPYISYEGTPSSTYKLICTRTPRPFKIVPDANNSGCLKIMMPDGKLCVDLTRSDRADGTPIILYQPTKNPNQAWTFKYMSQFNPTISPRFRMVNKATATIADLASNKRSVVCEDKRGFQSQVWAVETIDRAKNLYYIKNVQTNEYLSFSGNISASNPLLSTSVKKPWQIRLQGSSIPQLVKIYAPESNFLLDLTGSNRKPGTPVILYPTQNPGVNQQWKLETSNC
ncbi:hypothetical protein DL93DRAFT_2185839 [Clavulina sp. PMI_390]|nr:hypothetical protein DL93DRAFT_2185839 [Clavulina sp. PMI_390]